MSSFLNIRFLLPGLLSVLLSGLLAGLVQAADPLPPCPATPNCVSSLSDDPDRHVEPLPGAATPAQSMALLEQIVGQQPRTTWQSDSPRRADATFTTALLRFTDDVSFYIRDDGRIDVRSASRVGHWDLGANRRRVERLREALGDAMATSQEYRQTAE